MNGLYKKWFRPIYLKRSQKYFSNDFRGIKGHWMSRCIIWPTELLEPYTNILWTVELLKISQQLYTKLFQALCNVDVQNKYMFECLPDSPILSDLLPFFELGGCNPHINSQYSLW